MSTPSRRDFRQVLQAASFSAVLVGSSAVLAAPTITNLGVPPGSSASAPTFISGDASTVVGTGTSTPTKAFRWNSGVNQDLGLLSGGSAAQASGVSTDGSIVTGRCDVGNTTFAFRWTGSGMVSLGIPSGGTYTLGNAINGDGSVIVGELGTGNSTYNAFRWTSSTGVVNLGSVPGASGNSKATAVSADGTAVFGSNFASGGATTGFRWTSAAGMQSLGIPAGATSSNIVACTASGLAATGFGLTPGGARALRWTSAGGIQLLPSPAGVTFSSANAIGANGNMIGGFMSRNGVLGPFVWTPQRGMFDLTAYLAAQGVNLTGWTLTDVRSISNDGASLVGGGTFNGQARAYLVRGLQGLACPADFNGANAVTVQDIFDFLAAWFAASPSADFNGANGVTVQDIFDFLGAWFAGCP